VWFLHVKYDFWVAGKSRSDIIKISGAALVPEKYFVSLWEGKNRRKIKFAVRDQFQLKYRHKDCRLFDCRFCFWRVCILKN